MRNASLILNAILIVAVGILYYLHFNGPEKGATVSKQKTGTATGSPGKQKNPLQGEIVFINTDTLWNQYEYVNDMQSQLLDQKQRLESRYEKELRDFEKDYKTFQERAPYFSDRQRKIEQEKLVQREEQLMKLKEKLSMELAMNQEERGKEIQDAIYGVLDKYNLDNKHTFIFSMSAASDLIYADSTLDITDQIVRQLNNDYLESQQTGTQSTATE